MHPTNNNRYRELKVAGEFLCRDYNMTRFKRLNFLAVVSKKITLHCTKAKITVKDQEVTFLPSNTSIFHLITSSVVASKPSPVPLVDVSAKSSKQL